MKINPVLMEGKRDETLSWGILTKVFTLIKIPEIPGGVLT